MTTHPEQLIWLQKAAASIPMTREALYRHVKRHRHRVTRIGRRVYMHVDDVAKVKASHERWVAEMVRRHAGLGVAL